MESEEVHIRHVMLWEFRQDHSAKATAEKMCSMYGDGRITDLPARSCIVKFGRTTGGTFFRF